MSFSPAALRARFEALVPANSFRARLASGAFWSLFGTFLTQAASAIASFVIARLLHKVVYGELGMIYGTIGTLGLFAGLSLGATASKYIAEFRAKDPARAGAILNLCFLLAVLGGLGVMVIVLVEADWIALHILAAPHLAQYLRIASPMLVLTAIGGIQTGALAGFEAFKSTARYRAVTAVAAAIITITCTAIWGLTGTVIAMMAGSVIDVTACNVLLRHHCREHSVRRAQQALWSEISILWVFAVPALLAGLLYGPITWLAGTILAHQPGGYGELGMFNAANQWRTLIIFVPSAVGTALLPVLTNLHAEGDIPRALRALKAHLYFSAAVGFAAAVPLGLGSYWIMATYGRDFRAGWPALVFLAVAAVLQAMNNVVGQALASFNKMWIGFALNAIWAAELLGGTYVLRAHGAIGLAIAYCAAYFLHSLQQGGVVAAFFRSERRGLQMILPANGDAQKVSGV